MIKETINWNVKINSFGDASLLSEEQLLRIIRAFNSDFYQEWLIITSKNNTRYDEYPAARWQLKKSEQIEKQFHDNIKYNNDGRCSVEMDIMFPDSFEIYDVVNWCEGFNRLNLVNLHIHMEYITKNKKERNGYEEEYKFLTELTKNQEWIINGKPLKDY